ATSSVATLTVLVPPAITTEPQDILTIAGRDVSFSVTATGTEPLAYQWRKDGGSILDATNSTLAFINVQPADAGGYDVIVTNAAGSVTSRLASLTVVEARPLILTRAVSRKTHGAAGTFDLNLNLDPPASPTVEPRQGGPTWLVFTFSTNIMAADGTISANEFTLTNAAYSSASISASNLTLNLASVLDQQWVTVVLNGISDVAGNALSGDRDVVAGALYGDVNGSRRVDVVDFQQTKWRLGQTANSTNFWFDVNCSGRIDVVDLQRIKWGFGYTLAAWPPAFAPGSQMAAGASGVSSPSSLQYSTTPSLQPSSTAASGAELTGWLLGEAVGSPGLKWSSNGDEVWAPTMKEGEWAAVSGRIEDYEVSWIETAVTGPGTMTFQWKVSSEFNADFLKFSIDGADQPSRISGEVDWSPMTFSIPTGRHLLRWTYGKNGQKAAGLDGGWLRKVVFQATP
ncbi:MAG: hypothetical protein FJ388_15845, partial [Verrucomicrobia bacterium]|nr:hypothetical protein [Verrucomicrobiota bacterium]